MRYRTRIGEVRDEASPVIFLDRDGVLCEERSYVASLAGLHVFPYAKAAVGKMRKLGYRVIVITNQSCVARGFATEETVARIHEHLKRETGVDAIYCCPHLPPAAGEAETPPYRISCTCRKPRTGLIEQAARDFLLDMENAYFVGDRAGDIETGRAIGAHTVLLESGYGTARLEKPVRPDMTFDTLLDFVAYLEGKQGRSKELD